ncbi:MAG: integrin alpha, partial [Planctomycetota bacterium]
MRPLARLLLPSAGIVLAQLAFAEAAFAQIVIGAAEADLLMDGPSSSGFAEAAAIVPDLDGDGVADFAIGAIAYDPLDAFGNPINNAGAVVVFSSVTGLPIRTFEGVEPDGNLGFGIITVPDRDGDGVYELAAGAPRMSNNGVSESGAVVIFSGNTGAVLDTIYGQGGQGTLLGTSLAVIGDIDGDDVPEFIAGASGVGATNPLSPGFAVIFDGASLAPLQTLTGEEPGAIFGASVAGGGDLDGDTIPDFVVGAPLQDITGGQGGTSLDAGRIYAYSGADFSLMRAIQHQGGPETPKANFGTSVAVLGDIDGDGNADFAAGGPESQQGSGGNGFVAVYSGDTGQLIHDIDGAFVI